MRVVRCVVANTFTRRWEMQPYMDAAKRCRVPVRVIEARGKWANSHGVPADAIERMRARWDWLMPNAGWGPPAVPPSDG